MSKNKVKVTIFGSAYFLVTDLPEDLIQQSASSVDHIMKGLQHSIEDPSKIAVLAALQLASKLLLLEQEQHNTLREQQRIMERLNSLV